MAARISTMPTTIPTRRIPETAAVWGDARSAAMGPWSPAAIGSHYATRTPGTRLHVPRRAGATGRRHRPDRAYGRRRRVRVGRRDGPLLPDPRDRAGRAGDARGVH